MKKKITCLLLAFCLLFTGCGGAKKEDVENVIDDNYRMYYEVFVYSYADSNGDGIGDLNGLTSKLDYIEDLGCNGIWLMPIMPSTTYHKYDVIDYYDIDEQYGTMDDFKKLLEECDKRGIKVIIDFIFNHTSTKNQWFVEATDYLKTLKAEEEPDASVCPYVEYYNFSKEKKNGSYYQVEGTDWYYEGVFWDQMPDLNLGCEALRSDIEEIASYWLDLGVHGFRLDAAKEYYSGSADKNVEVLSWFSNYVKSQKEDAYLVAEVWDSYLTISNYYESGIDSIFNYTFGNNDGQIIKALTRNGLGDAGSKISQNIVTILNNFAEKNPNMIDAPFLSNHDTGRIAGFVSYDERKVKIAGAMNILMSGSAFLYYGEELGMTGSGIDENKRAPMYWSADGSAEETTTAPPNMETVEHRFGSYEEQKDDENSIYQYYKEVIHLRNKYPLIGRGTVAAAEGEFDGNIYVYSKTYEGKTMYFFYNLADETKEITLDSDCYKNISLLESVVTSEEEVTYESQKLSLPSFSVAIVGVEEE